MKDYYTIKKLAEILGVPQRTLQRTIMMRNKWSAFLERNGYNGKSKKYFLRLFDINREHVKQMKERAAKIKSSKREGKYGGFSKDSANVIARRKKEEELRQIEERIEQLEADMAAVVFDREINSQLQALYIKRRCAREWLGIKDDGIIEDCYL